MYLLLIFIFKFFFIAQDNNKFASELVPISTKVKGKDEMFCVDEHPRPQSTIEALNKLKPVFKKDGTVTAGNASVSFIFIHYYFIFLSTAFFLIIVLYFEYFYFREYVMVLLLLY